MSHLETLRDELLFREQEAYETLFDLVSEEQIRELCRRADEMLRTDGISPFSAMTQEQFSDFVKQTFAGIKLDYRDAILEIEEHEFFKMTFYAVLSALHFRDIQKRLVPFLGKDIAVPAEYMALIALGVSIGTLPLTEAGWRPAENSHLTEKNSETAAKEKGLMYSARL